MERLSGSACTSLSFRCLQSVSKKPADLSWLLDLVAHLLHVLIVELLDLLPDVRKPVYRCDRQDRLISLFVCCAVCGEVRSNCLHRLLFNMQSTLMAHSVRSYRSNSMSGGSVGVAEVRSARSAVESTRLSLSCLEPCAVVRWPTDGVTAVSLSSADHLHGWRPGLLVFVV